MGTTIESRSQESMSDCVVPDALPEVFSDGFSQLLVGPAISKVLLHSVTIPATGSGDIEQRQAVMRLTMPTAQLIEMCRKVLANVCINQGTFADMAKNLQMHIDAALQGVSVSPQVPAQTNDAGSKPQKKRQRKTAL